MKDRVNRGMVEEESLLNFNHTSTEHWPDTSITLLPSFGQTYMYAVFFILLELT